MAEGRPRRSKKLPKHLEDFVLERYASSSTTSSGIARLRFQRDFVCEDIDRDCAKASKLISEKGSRTVLRRIDERLEKSLRELERLTDNIVSDRSEIQEGLHATQLLKLSQRQVENQQDLIKADLEARESRPPSVISGLHAIHNHRHLDQLKGLVEKSRKMQGVVTSTTRKLSKVVEPEVLGTGFTIPRVSPPRFLDDDDNLSQVSHKTTSSVKSMEAEIKAEIATLRVKQEKERFEEEMFIQEKKKELEMKRREDEAVRARMEAKLWSKARQTPSVDQVEVKNVVPQLPPLTSQDIIDSETPVKPKVSFQEDSRGVTTKIDKQPNSESPRKSMLEELLMSSPGDFENQSEIAPKEEAGQIRRFFQGIAKPKIPEFRGERYQFEDWWEQFNIFVHKAEVPVHFKMVMLKSSLTGPPSDLVKNLGFTQVQYEMAIEKLKQRYGGERRLLQQYIDSVTSMPEDTKLEDLKGLSRMADKLFDLSA